MLYGNNFSTSCNFFLFNESNLFKSAENYSDSIRFKDNEDNE